MFDRKRTGSHFARAALALAALLGASEARASEVEFYASLDRDELSLSDTLTMTVTLSGGSPDEGSLKLPDCPAFRLLSRSESQQISLQAGSGRTGFRRTKNITLLLAPTKVGTFRCTAGQARIDGKLVETGELRVKVLQSPAQGQRQRANDPLSGPLPGPHFEPDDPFAQLFEQREASESDLFLRAQLEKDQVYVGEQLLFTLYLFSRTEVAAIENVSLPALDDFWVEELDKGTQVQGELKMIGGVPFNVFKVKRRALFPLKAGTYTLGPAQVDLSTGYGVLFRGRRMRRLSPPVKLEVLPLPPGDGAQAGGAVGTFELRAQLAPDAGRVGQPMTLTLTLEGTGNVRGTMLPSLPEVAGLRSFEPTVSDKLELRGERLVGRRTAEYLLLPERAGRFELPALQFDYFDPSAKEWRQSSTSPLAIIVESADALGGAPGSQTPNGVNRLPAGELRPLRHRAALALAKPPLYRRPLFFALALLPFLLWLALAIGSKARRALRPGEAARRKRVVAAARQRVRRAMAAYAAAPGPEREPSQPNRRSALRQDALYSELARALYDALEELTGHALSGSTRAELFARLGGAGLSEAQLEQLGMLLDACDAGRFAPGAGSAESQQRLADSALNLIDQAERELRPRGTGSALPALLLCAGLCLPTPAAQAATSAEPQERLAAATELCTQGKLAECIAEYEQLRGAGYGGADLHYNLGTAYLKAEKLGPGLLNLERALRDAPGDEEILANLERANKLRRDRLEGAAAEEGGEAPLTARIAAHTSPNLWAALFLALWVPGLFALLLRRFASGRAVRAALLLLGLGALTASLPCGAITAAHALHRAAAREAIVMAPSTPVREGPALLSASSFELHEGLKVRLLDVDGPFVKVRLANGLQGWVSREALAPLE